LVGLVGFVPAVDTHRHLLYTEIMDKVFAQVDIGQAFTPARSFPTFGDLVSVIVKNAFMFAGVITFVLLIFGGFGFIVGAGSGDTKKMEQAQKTITGAVVGLLLVVASYWIIQILEKITGVSLLTPNLGL